MSKDGITIGIDQRENIYFVARVNHSTGRPDIKALVRFDADNFNGHHLLEGSRIIVSVPDNQTMVKHVRLPNPENAYEKVLFELESATGENRDNFLFDIIPTKLENSFIGLTIRRQIIHKIVEPFTKLNGDLNFSTGGVMRSVALGRGFLTYCQQSGGEFGAIAEFSEQEVSLAIYYKQQIIDVVGIPLKLSSQTDNETFQRGIIELKTLLNFKLATLLKLGISVPLSKLYLISDSLTDEQMELLTDILKIEIAHPEIHTGFITDRNKNQEIPLEKYLVALGLTIL